MRRIGQQILIISPGIDSGRFGGSCCPIRRPVLASRPLAKRDGGASLRCAAIHGLVGGNLRTRAGLRPSTSAEESQ